ncbi:MAG: transketolase [Candidatus Methanofastidiosum methylothiophilum]|uniref:Transketolase n=1 Tax=Candidatus Methanofastidiosum methylothiophilum TaxID=1705564 RepID=A0A150J7P3_9EURY|nr:MAG: transketolase [Candidatus Methanofastidiosum methylthiophilus]
MFQIIDSNGKLVGLDPNLDEKLLKEMYWWMVYARMADDKALKLQRQGRIGTFPPTTGQEATQVGSGLATDKEDWIFPAFRELGTYLLRGIPLEKMFLYFMGDVRGNIIPENVRNLPMYVPVSTQIPQAVGAAYGMKLSNKKNAVVCFFGDGATSKGDFSEGLNFAGIFNTPNVFICQNNQWAISVPRKKQTASKTIAQKAIAYGFPGILVDGNDVLAMYLATKEALERAKSGDGPTLIEAYTYRLRMHTTADDPTRYRTDEELKEWEQRDPITRFRIYLESLGIWSKEWQKELETKAEDMIKKAIEKAENIEELKPEDLFSYMYLEMNPSLTEQLDYLKKMLATKEIEENSEKIEGGFP